MSKTAFTVDVARRDQLGSAACRRLRRAGQVPAVVYGMGLDPFPVSVSPRRIDEVLTSDTGRNTIFDLKLADGGGEQSRAAMIKDLTRDPVTSAVLHVDFVRVDLSQAVQVEVPIHLVGESEGVKIGGNLEQIHRVVLVECLPGDIPESLDVDISPLQIGDQVHVSDLAIPEKVTLLTDLDQVLLLIAAPVAEEEEETEEAAEAAEAEGEAAPAEGEEGSGSTDPAS